MGKQTFYWYDYETFGVNPMVDRPVQFAGIRTDEELNIIDEPLEIYCKPADDFLPQPMSSLITGITPQQALTKGIPEAEFIRRINKEFSHPNTCVLGYNSLRFDDEVTRYSLYRNLFDPYAREWQNGCSRWDMIDVVRLTRALRPDGIEWPTYEDGRPSLRLEDLTKANGISHDSAHDALSDVHATIAIARLIKEKQPKLYDYAYNNRSKQKIFSMLNMRAQNPVLHISGMYPTEQGNMAIVVPIAAHPTNKNGIIVFDLSHNPEILYSLRADEIHERIFTPTDELPEGIDRIPVKTIHANKCPIVAPIGTLNAEAAARYKIDLGQCKKNLDFIKASGPVSKKIQKVFSAAQFEKRSDPDYTLYGGPFFSNEDKNKMMHIHTLDAEQLAAYETVFDDARLPEMLFRFRARNWPESLSEDEKQHWQEFRKDRLNTAENGRLNFASYFNEIETLRQAPERSGDDWLILDELEAYGKQLADSLQ